MATKLVIANWKATKTKQEATEWVSAFSRQRFPSKDIHVVICPPVVSLYTVYDQLQKTTFPFQVSVGVQDLSAYPDGTYTGEVTARMVSTIATHAILGHSERRRWFCETSQRVAMKVEQSLYHHIAPVVSVDRDNWRTQLGQFSDDVLEQLVVMYEPPEAISELDDSTGRGQASDLTDVEAIATLIKAIANGIPVLYGGSVKGKSVGRYTDSSLLSGVVVGTASMDVDEFTTLINKI